MLILACALMILLAGLYALLPLFRNSGRDLELEFLAETELDKLLYKKAIIYGNLKDLEFEYKVGRLVDEDFHQLESGYKLEAASVLQKLDLLGAGIEIDEAMEREIAARKAELFKPGGLPKEDSARCRSCGARLIPGKKFCADCGKPIDGTVTQ
jgi:hypothetical protein